MKELKSKLDSELKKTVNIDFEQEIMNKIKINENAKAGFLEKLNDLLSGFYNSFNIKYAFIFLFGIGLGIIAMTFIKTQKVNLDNDSMLGTMSDISTYSNFSRGGNLYIEKQSYDLNINTQYSTRMILAQIDIQSSDQLKIVIGYDKTKLLITGLKVLKNNDVNNLMTGYSQIELSNQGEGKYLLFFEKRYDSPQNLSVKVYQNSTLVEESSIRTEN
jgi:hypothetical protein